MARFTKEELSKLPKWARDKISGVEYFAGRTAEENKILTGTHKESDTYVTLDYPHGFYLEDYTRVRFARGNLEVIVNMTPDGHCRVDIGDGVIIPSARNVFNIVDKHNKLNL